MNAETTKKVQELMVISKQSSISPLISLKKKREQTSETLLKVQNIKHGEKCKRCELNCEVKHRESVTFWAVVDGLEPVYNLENCPKQGKLEKNKMTMKRRVK